jgi:4-methyl-5(b-hydroxyethyl)-thiazole monophosphate biosynthesis
MKVLLFLAKGFETMEFSVFVDVMGWARNDYGCDITVDTCGFQKQVVSTFGVPVIVDKTIDGICADDYDALAIPGGFEDFGFYEEAYDPRLSELIRAFHTRNKPIASICVAALALAKSGILTGKKATTYHLQGGGRQKQLAAFGVDVVNEPVVETDNIITSYCPQTAPDVAFRLLEKLAGSEMMHTVKAAMGYA